jgi:putative ABC transport system substrate-binding protein
MPVIGFLNPASPQPWKDYIAGFRAGLKEAGYLDGQNVTFRWAEGHYDRLPEMAADLVRRKVAVLVATGGAPSVVTAKGATSTIPIVFTSGVDPIHAGKPVRLEISTIVYCGSTCTAYDENAQRDIDAH